jgi:phage baseplate assembly protein W
VAEDAHLLSDIRLELRQHELRPVYVVATRQQRQRIGDRAVTVEDFDTIGGRQNLGQAVVIRLLTPRGELAPLGHPEYGSRVHELIGRQNTDTTRNLLKLYILESLQMEPRIARVIRADVAAVAHSRQQVSVTLEVQPIGASATVTIGPFTLEL